ncbi:chemotaxis protein CheA [bacterium]|nr:chemotaxis protein CheA [bacterium]
MRSSEDMDDYVAECDEHLSAARQCLLDLEDLQHHAVSRETLDSLFRAFHSMKGLSGMVGARAAEQSAHNLESYLSAVRKDPSLLSDAGISFLIDGMAILEAKINNFIRDEPESGVDVLAERLSSLLPDQSADNTKESDLPLAEDDPQKDGIPPEKLEQLQAAVSRSEQIWRFTFRPSTDLAARGINVGTVRSRLQTLGSLVLAQPMTTVGGLEFHFYVTTKADAAIVDMSLEGVAAEPFVLQPQTNISQKTSDSSLRLSPGNLVRVDLSRLDELVRSLGELVVSRARMQDILTQVATHLPGKERRALDETVQTFERQLRELREGVMRVRMVPVRDLFARMRMVVRDVTRELGKDAELIIAGEDTEVDKLVVERMADPILHLVRNSLSHGLESPVERSHLGKSAKGKVTLRAATTGGMLVLDVEDDGRGIDAEQVFDRARKLGLISPNGSVDPTSILDLICTPGFSTREEVDRTSGRGVGMDVVRLAVEDLGGSLTLDAQPGLGTKFTLRVPLSLVIADVVTISVADQIYALPKTAVREVIPFEFNAPIVLENNELIRHHHGVLPLLRLSDVFRLPRATGNCVALIIGEGAATFALAADRAVGLREVVVRAITDPLVEITGIAGATELGDGRPILILDPIGLMRLARRLGMTRTVTLGAS